MNEKVSETALIKAFSNSIASQLKPSRVKGQFEQIEKIATNEIKTMVLTEDRRQEFMEKFKRWNDETKWGGQEKHVVTAVSFMLAVLDGSKYNHNKRYYEKFNNIFDFYENKKIYPACMAGGKIAYEKWKNVMEVEGLGE